MPASFVNDLVRAISELNGNLIVLSIGGRAYHLWNERIRATQTLGLSSAFSLRENRGLIYGYAFKLAKMLDTYAATLQLATADCEILHCFDICRPIPELGRNLVVKHTLSRTCFSYFPEISGFDKLLYAALRNYTGIVVTSNLFSERLRKLGIPQEKLAVIPLGVDTNLFRPDGHKLGMVRPRVGWFGAVAPSNQDDLECMLKLAKRNESYTFNFYTKFSRPILLSDAGKNVISYGRQNSMAETLSKIDVLVLPFSEKSSFIFQPLTIVEAIACGIPVITTKGHGLDELVRHEWNGFLAEDFAELNSYLNLLLSDEDMWTDFSKNSRALARERFSIERIAQSYMKAWEDARAARA